MFPISDIIHFHHFVPILIIIHKILEKNSPSKANSQAIFFNFLKLSLYILSSFTLQIACVEIVLAFKLITQTKNCILPFYYVTEVNAIHVYKYNHITYTVSSPNPFEKNPFFYVLLLFISIFLYPFCFINFLKDFQIQVF